MWALLNEIKTALQTINEFKTVKIGIEKGINAGITPAARIVTESRSVTTQMQYYDQGVLKVIIFLDLKNDIEELYEQSIILEEKVREVLKDIVNFRETIYDQDGVTVFKSTILRFSFDTIRNSKAECDNELG